MRRTGRFEAEEREGFAQGSGRPLPSRREGRRRLHLFLLLLLLLPGGPSARAAEIDSFTDRHQALRNAAPQLDAWLNAHLREGVKNANAAAPGCDEGTLREEIRDTFSFPFVGHFVAEELNEMEALDKRHVRLEESVYRDLGLFDAVSVHWKDLSAVVRVGEAQVGVDKIGHFLAEGWKYYEIALLEGEGVEAAMDWGESAERSYFGLFTTSVYSYADLVANLEGLRFWTHLVGDGPDPLGVPADADPPYVVCSEGSGDGPERWALRREVELAHYVSSAWDEAVNCPRYRSEAIAERVRQRVAALGREYRCPVRPVACVEARERYGDRAERLLHPRCLEAERPWWHLLWPPNWGLFP